MRRRLGYMPEQDCHIPGMTRRGVRGVRGGALGPAARRGDQPRARGALLRRPRRGALPQRRDLLDRHEAAREAGAGAGARPRPAAARRAHERARPAGPRGDAGAHPRHRHAARDEPDPVLAPAPRRRARLRPGDRAQPGADRAPGRDARADGRSQAGLRRALQGRRDRRAHRPQGHGRRLARGRRRRFGCSCPRARGRTRCSAWPSSAGCRCATCGPAPRRSRTCSCAPSATRSRTDADLRPGLPPLRGARAAAQGALLADHARGAAARARRSAPSWACWPRAFLPFVVRVVQIYVVTRFPRGGPHPADRRPAVRRLPEPADRLHDPALDLRRLRARRERPAHRRDPRLPVAPADAARLRARQAAGAAARSTSR